jgi:hypothetical protein
MFRVRAMARVVASVRVRVSFMFGLRASARTRASTCVMAKGMTLVGLGVLFVCVRVELV